MIFDEPVTVGDAENSRSDVMTSSAMQRGLACAGRARQDSSCSASAVRMAAGSSSMARKSSSFFVSLYVTA